MIRDFIKAARKPGQEHNLRIAILGHAEICPSDRGASSKDWEHKLRKNSKTDQATEEISVYAALA